MTKGEKIAVVGKRVVSPVVIGLLCAVWGALVYTGGPAEALITGQWQVTLADRGWQMSALFLSFAIGGVIAPIVAMWSFHKALTRIREIRKSGLAAWLQKIDSEWLADIRKRSQESMRVGRDK